jgi:hypothetical protein
LDLLFADSNGRLLLIEVKANALSRRDVGQAGEYYGLMKIEYPDREIRMGVFATSVEREQRIYLEAINVEVYIFDTATLEKIAIRNHVDPVKGIVREKEMSRKSSVPVSEIERVPVLDEASYFKLIEGLDSATQEKLAAIYGAVKKHPFTHIEFLERGRIVVSVRADSERSVDVLFVGVDFKGPLQSPARGTLTLLWKRMLQRVSAKSLEPFAMTLDRLLARDKMSLFLDRSEKAGTYDTIVLDKDFKDEKLFGDFLSGLDTLFDCLFEELKSEIAIDSAS